MIYAEVIINQKTKDWKAIFDYEVTPEVLPYIKRGSLVEVSFGTKGIVEGVVVKLKKNLPCELKGRVKKIKRILQSETVVYEREFELAWWMAERFVATIGESMFGIIPPIPKKEVKLSGNEGIKPYETRINKGQGKYYLVTENIEKRHRSYFKIVGKNRAEKLSTVIIFPDLKLLENFVEKNRNEIEKFKWTQYSSSDANSARFKKWLEIREGNFELVIGSRMLALCGPKNIGTIIVEETNNSGHFEDQSPRYNSQELTKFWRGKGVDVVEGDLLPSLEHLVAAKKNEITLTSANYLKPRCEVELVGMDKEKSIISHPLENLIEETIKQKENLLIFLPRKGDGSITACRDCGHILTCEKCDVPLISFGGQDLKCNVCGKNHMMPKWCERCRGTNIESRGLGNQKIAGQILRLIEGKYKVYSVDKEHELTDLKEKAIYVATQAIFRYKIEVENSAILSGDIFIDRPDYSASERAFEEFFQVCQMTKKKLLIQTKKPDNLIYTAIGSGGYQKMMRVLLEERKKFGYPPYYNLVKIEISEGKDKIGKTAEKIVDLLGSSRLEGEILGPISAYHGKVGNNLVWQIIIKGWKQIDYDLMQGIRELGGKLFINPKSLV